MSIIRQFECPWASLLYMFPKAATGDWRPCGDNRALNNATVPDRYSVPYLKDFAGVPFGKSGFRCSGPCFTSNSHLPRRRFEDAVSSPYGLFELLCMTFGLRNASQTFQSFVARVFRGLPFVFAHFYDLLVASSTAEEHMSIFQRRFTASNNSVLFSVESGRLQRHHTRGRNQRSCARFSRAVVSSVCDCVNMSAEESSKRSTEIRKRAQKQKQLFHRPAFFISRARKSARDESRLIRSTKKKPPVEAMLELLATVQPYVVWGYADLATTRNLILKRGKTKVGGTTKSLTNALVEEKLGQFGLLCIEDVIHELTSLGPHLREVLGFLLPFRIMPPTGDWTGVIKKTHHPSNQRSGNRSEFISQLVNKMV
ncbi:60S ribosomal protein L7 [Sparganum proliferum]